MLFEIVILVVICFIFLLTSEKYYNYQNNQHNQHNYHNQHDLEQFQTNTTQPDTSWGPKQNIKKMFCGRNPPVININQEVKKIIFQQEDFYQFIFAIRKILEDHQKMDHLIIMKKLKENTKLIKQQFQ